MVHFFLDKRPALAANGRAPLFAEKKIMLSTQRDSQSFVNLSDDYDEESIDPHVDCIAWDDPRMDSDLISMYIFNSDEQNLARLLINEYQADKKLPEFIPLNLTSFMISLVHSFK